MQFIISKDNVDLTGEFCSVKIAFLQNRTLLIKDLQDRIILRDVITAKMQTTPER